MQSSSSYIKRSSSDDYKGIFILSIAGKVLARMVTLLDQHSYIPKNESLWISERTWYHRHDICSSTAASVKSNILITHLYTSMKLKIGAIGPFQKCKDLDNKAYLRAPPKVL